VTIRRKLEGLLIESGVKPADAREIVEIYANDRYGEAVAGRLDEDASGYPEMMFVICWSAVKKIAVEWIDQNKPGAWYRDVLAGTLPAGEPT
jgi:hypothetical protein